MHQIINTAEELKNYHGDKMSNKTFCTYHEYRFSYGTAKIVGMITGLIDALTDDWTIKAFLWSSVLIMYIIVVSYEFIMMETPPRPLLQAILFQLSILGLLSTHHFIWYAVSIMIGRKIDNILWLAPNIYMDFVKYTETAIAMYIIYVAYLMYINIKSCD